MQPLTLNHPIRLYRAYSESSCDDSNNIIYGRCPDYALYWGIQENIPHWPQGHNFLKGYNNKNNKNNNNIFNSTEKQYSILRDILEERLTKNNYQPLIFIELNNILVDEDKGLQDIQDKNFSEPKYECEHEQLNQKMLSIYKNLGWTPHGEELWTKLKQYNPIILTSIGAYSHTLQIRADMLDWVKTNLGPNIRVISAHDNDKKKYKIANSLLIDTKNYLHGDWEGYKYIHYTPNSNIDEIVKIVSEHIQEYSI
jgi:hypothetical protein